MRRVFERGERDATQSLKKQGLKKKLSYYIYWFIIKLSRSNKIFRVIIALSALAFYKIFQEHKCFIFRGEKYYYFCHPYNRTVASERVVEIPIARKVLEEYSGKRILEIGNVLAHYFPIKHDVLDKYEKAAGVMNEDVTSFNFNKKYDLIISISTMEHVGFSYGEKKESDKFLRGIKNLKRHLAKNGKIFITLPVFYNPFIDKLIKERRMPFDEEYFLKRNAFLNEWTEVNYEEALKGRNYDSYFANANILYIGVLES